MTAPDPPCDLLDWDSTFFGHRIARARASRFDEASCQEVLDWCRTHRVECLYVLADEDDPATHGVLDTTGFRRVDRRVTLERTLGTGVAPVPHGTRGAREDDIPVLRAIAGVSHRNTRFHADGRFDRERCDELYRIWIERSCRGWADHVVVAVRGEAPVGYVTVHLEPPAAASIGLVGVEPAYRRHGVGRTLMQGALAWLAGRSVTRVRVVTQGDSAAALRFYEDAGFRPTHAALWYHRWLETPPPLPR